VTLAAFPRLRRRLDPRAWRAALWANRALTDVRRALGDGQLEGIAVVQPPRLPSSAEPGVGAVLRRRSASCLERSLVLQRWHAAHGRPLEVVIGVRAPVEGFMAHAWLDGEPPPPGMTFDDLVRLKP
jgi:transglutaminase superfamily protein